MPPPRVLLTIAGFDPSSGAGVTADLMTFAAHGYFGTSAITALTVQSTQGVFGVSATDPAVLRATLRRLQEDLPPAGVKIGMLKDLGSILGVTDYLQSLDSSNSSKYDIPIVLDPVVKSSSGAALLEPEAVQRLQEDLLPRVDWITPNYAELALLTGRRVISYADIPAAIEALVTSYPKLNVVVTGGDQESPTEVVRLASGESFVVHGQHVESRATHGTGCAFSSALLCRLVAGASAREAVEGAKAYVREAILRAPGLGSGKGPMQLLWPLQDHANR